MHIQYKSNLTTREAPDGTKWQKITAQESAQLWVNWTPNG